MQPSSMTVPIVGEPFETIDLLITAVARCKCAPENKPFLIPGVDAAKICSGCGNVYAITAVHYNRRVTGMASAPSLQVAIIGNRRDLVERAKQTRPSPLAP